MPTEIWSSQDEEEEEKEEEEEVTLIKSRDPYLAGGGKHTHQNLRTPFYPSFPTYNW